MKNIKSSPLLESYKKKWNEVLILDDKKLMRL